MPLTTRRNNVSRSTTVTRKPSLMYRLTHPTTRAATTTAAPRRRTKAIGPAPVSTHRRARTKPTLGARIHG